MSPPVENLATRSTPVGARDAFDAGVLRWLWDAHRLDPWSAAALDDPELRALLALGRTVAALQCSRAGASPPTLAEVRAFAGR